MPILMLKSSKLVFCLGKQRRTYFPPFLTENYDKLQIIKNTHWQIQVNPLITLFWTFRWWKIRSFLSHKVGGKMIFTDYGEVLVLNFSVMGNKVFFTAKKLMERWYLRGLFVLSMIFQDLGNTAFRAVHLILTMVTLVSHSYDLFQQVLLIEMVYKIVNMIRVINKKARAT